ncbi:MAG: hypothetical protein IJ856_00355 [Candidatus Methanomethylophilaceae archaeon]|nr:hypothetical protein [Candidatus Methanomethylophilaceae archaeon]
MTKQGFGPFLIYSSRNGCRRDVDNGFSIHPRSFFRLFQINPFLVRTLMADRFRGHGQDRSFPSPGINPMPGCDVVRHVPFLVIQPEEGAYSSNPPSIVLLDRNKFRFSNLDEAITFAKERFGELASKDVARSWATNVVVDYDVIKKTYGTSDSGNVVSEVKVVARATGKPDLTAICSSPSRRTVPSGGENHFHRIRFIPHLPTGSVDSSLSSVGGCLFGEDVKKKGRGFVRFGSGIIRKDPC